MPRTVQQELAATNKEIEGLIAKRARLQREVAEFAKRRPAPPESQDKWTIDVRFTEDGKLYQFLVLRVGHRYYTTGTGETGLFHTWTAFLKWLDEEVVQHSAMIPLAAYYSVPGPLEGKRA